MEKQERHSGEDWDTDLETEDPQNRRQSLSRAELYLKACQQTGTSPVSSFLSHLGEAHLNLNYYGLGPLGAKALAIALQCDNDTTNLELEHNGLQAEGVRYLMKMLQRNTTICSLVNSTLKELQLSYNNFGYMEAKSLGQALKKNCTLVLLDLSSNNMDDQAVTLLCEGLASNNTLSILKRFLKERNETIMDFFQALDKEGVMEVSTLAFMKAVKDHRLVPPGKVHIIHFCSTFK
ncbi:Leucine-rich repeat-containing protein 74A [Channa argus]|uniref:Leucine-rich repeat-containing protein 74A n=1 Tax=Channa argus TaxID=215402 RepID=A0A6G1QKQ1_CHAAH|nr:Leucine-rich repeat-containing protein 74A [Channa argus]